MDSSRNRNLMGRAVLALLLTLGFYGLALLIAFALLFMVYAEFAYIGQVNLRLTFFALFGAGAILWAIFPRIDRFAPPGPRVSAQEAPGLFEVIEKISGATGQSMPREIYLVPDVNAFVAERGGMMGIGSRRVMGIGVPLLHLVTVDELRAILAHEFGHFYGGDTALGPWIYRTRTAIIRTVGSVGQASGLLQAPFVGYAKLFLRITNAVSRQQEYSADRLAARTTGTQAIASGLQKIHKYGPAFDSYFQQEYAPALNAGYQPPMLEGFELFIASPRILQAIDELYEKHTAAAQTDPYDSHPSLKERLAALQNLSPGLVFDSRPASALISTTAGLESALVEALAVDREKARGLRKINWDEMTSLVLLPQWEETAAKYAPLFGLLTPAHLPELARNRAGLFEKVADLGKFLPRNVSADKVAAVEQTRMVTNVVGSTLIAALRREGWKVSTGPGEDVTLCLGDRSIKPFEAYWKLEKGDMSAEEWQRICAESGISGVEFRRFLAST